MTHLNKAWGILAKEVPIVVTAYGRQFAEAVYNGKNLSAIDALVPYNKDDYLNRSYRIEELIKLIRRSSLADRFNAWDSFNTYGKASLTYPKKGVYTSSTVDLNPKITGSSPVGNILCFGSVSGTTLTYNASSYNVKLGLADAIQSFSFTNGTSGDIPVINDSLFIRLRSTIPASFDFSLAYVEDLSVDFADLIKTLESLKYTFSSIDLRKIWREEYNWVDRLSAYVLDVLESSSV